MILLATILAVWAPVEMCDAQSGSSMVVESAPTRSISSEEPTSAPLPKVAIVVVGDPDPMITGLAGALETELTRIGRLRLPADPSFRAALAGLPGSDGDGLDEVRTERRRLGLDEARDAPLLAVLGRRAGASLVVAVRGDASGGEALALDVRSGQYFEGSAALSQDLGAAVRFVTRCARAATRGAMSAPSAAEPGIVGPTEPAAPIRSAAPTEDWLGENWPYIAAGGLLAAAIAFVAVTATDGATTTPMLRFQSGVP
jgi:hypothetical protein